MKAIVLTRLHQRCRRMSRARAAFAASDIALQFDVSDSGVPPTHHTPERFLASASGDAAG
jgi:hypothetical protein